MKSLSAHPEDLLLNAVMSASVFVESSRLNSRRAGLGVFALVDIPPYTFLGIYTGLALSAADAQRGHRGPPRAHGRRRGAPGAVATRGRGRGRHTRVALAGFTRAVAPESGSSGGGGGGGGSGEGRR